MKLLEDYGEKFFANRKKATIITLLLFIILLFLLSNILSGYYYRILLLFGINVILTLSLNITNGYADIFSLGHGGLMLAGGYTTALLTLPIQFKSTALELPFWLEQAQLPFLLSMLIAGFIA